jgi:Fur family peroxide stress response transcriptional regulator
VYERLKPQIPGLSLGTVYRNINLFQEEGQVISVGVVNGEERFDGQVTPHPHFICSCCGKIVDLPRLGNETLEELVKPSVTDTDFTIDYRKTVFYGLCGECRELSAGKAQAAAQELM